MCCKASAYAIVRVRNLPCRLAEGLELSSTGGNCFPQVEFLQGTFSSLKAYQRIESDSLRLSRIISPKVN